tara:strand:+ start:977 stop:1396 length:420 start_codon:yes stop_codon:yes gene_type:complete
MPEHIYSQVDKECLMLSINRYEEIREQRIDITPENEILQASVKRLKAKTSFPAHKHNIIERVTNRTQESWVLIEGRIKASFYDLDDSTLYECELKKGDMAVVYRAGHSFEVIDEGTVLYEFKNGPYYGKTKDKTMIETN